MNDVNSNTIRRDLHMNMMHACVKLASHEVYFILYADSTGCQVFG